MSWSRRAALRLLGSVTLAGSLPALSACGFRPVYGTGAGAINGAQVLRKIDIATIPDRPGQLLRNLLIDRFYGGGYPSDAAYRLEVTLVQSTNTAAVRPDQSADRLQIATNASFRVIDIKTGKVVMADGVSSQTAATGLDQQYAYVAGVQAAGERTLIEIADEMTTRIAAALGQTLSPAS